MLGLVGNLFDVFLVLAQVEVVDELEEQLLVDGELDAHLLLKLIPVPVPHGVVSQLSDEWQEDEPLLDLVHDTNVGISSLVDLHVFQGLHELLDLVFHLERLGLEPLSVLEVLESVLALADVVPEILHVVDDELDTVDVLDGLVDHLGLAELGRVVSEIGDLLLKVSQLIEDTVELGLCLLGSTVVLEELSFLHVSSELGDRLLELLDVVGVTLALFSNVRGDLLASFLGDLLDIGPLLLQLGELLNLSVLRKFLGLEELEGLLELVNLESDHLLLPVALLDVLLHLKKSLDVLEILVLGVDLLLGLGKLRGESLEVLLDVLVHSTATEHVVLFLGTLDELSFVRRASHGLKLAILVKEVDVDEDLASLVGGVLDIVLTVVGISDTRRDFNLLELGLGLDFLILFWWDWERVAGVVHWNWLLLYLDGNSSDDFNLEVVATRGSVLVLIVSSLNGELSWMVWSDSWQETRSIAEGLVGSGVEEILEVNPSGGDVLSADDDLHDGLPGSKLTEVRGQASDLTRVNESARNGLSVFAYGVAWLVAKREENADSCLLELLAVN